MANRIKAFLPILIRTENVGFFQSIFDINEQIGVELPIHKDSFAILMAIILQTNPTFSVRMSIGKNALIRFATRQKIKEILIKNEEVVKEHGEDYRNHKNGGSY